MLTLLLVVSIYVPQFNDYREYREDRCWSEESIPNSIKFVHCEVLSSTTPIQLVKLAAGHHQHLQSESRACNTEDVCHELGAAMERKYDVNSNNFGLSDAELFLGLQTIGLTTESKVPIPRGKAVKKNPSDLAVCFMALN